MSIPGVAAPAFSVLIVCTGNICRSAFAQELGRAYLDEAKPALASQLRIASAGTRAVEGAGMHPHSALVLAGFGASAVDFRAQQLVDSMPAAADLILTMTRSHRLEVLARNPRCLARTFTLLEAASLLSMVSESAAVGEALPDRARGLVAALASARSRREVGEDDVPDPIDGGLLVHAAVGDLIAEALLPLLERIARS